MSRQPVLSFLPPVSRKTDPDTSKKAESLLDPSGRLTIMKRIYRSLVNDGPATYWELAERLSLNPQQTEKRISDLKNNNLVRDSGDRAVGKAGRDCTRWESIR